MAAFATTWSFRKTPINKQKEKRKKEGKTTNKGKKETSFFLHNVIRSFYLTIAFSH